MFQRQLLVTSSGLKLNKHEVEVVGRGSETQLQVGENLDKIT